MPTQMADEQARRELWNRLAPEREKWKSAPRPTTIEPVLDGEELVWDFPRPPRMRRCGREYRVEALGQVIARSTEVIEVCETAGAPVPYFTPDDVRGDLLVARGATALCEWKGEAQVYDLLLPREADVPHRIEQAAWSYPVPFDYLKEGYALLAGRFCFHPGRTDCFIDNHKVGAQPGGYYSGWVHQHLRGPIKGGEGTSDW